jgi:hypothetical protein
VDKKIRGKDQQKGMNCNLQRARNSVASPARPYNRGGPGRLRRIDPPVLTEPDTAFDPNLFDLSTSFQIATQDKRV